MLPGPENAAQPQAGDDDGDGEAGEGENAEEFEVESESDDEGAFSGYGDTESTVGDTFGGAWKFCVDREYPWKKFWWNTEQEVAQWQHPRHNSA